MTDLPKPVGNTAKTSFPDLSASTASLCSSFKIRPPRRSDKRSRKILSLAAERSGQNKLSIFGASCYIWCVNMLEFHKLQWQRADSILLFINQSNSPMLGRRRNLNASVTKENAVPPSFPTFSPASPRLSLASHSRFPRSREFAISCPAELRRDWPKRDCSQSIHPLLAGLPRQRTMKLGSQLTVTIQWPNTK